VIICAMREHQRYFALEDDKGKLLNKFIAVNNTRPQDLAVVAKGHQRVLRARLADARFFFREDTKRSLFSRLDELKEVVFHAKLGTSFEKVERFTALARFLAQQIAPDKIDQVERAARLAKCDLVTEMVGEFPSLQGVVGGEYALRDGEAPEVAAALREHYQPTQAGGPLPEGVVGALVGLADRLDTLCGFLGVGMAPSGAADPYGLRRAAIGAIRLVTENGYHISLHEVLGKALVLLSDKLTAPLDVVRDQVGEFIAERLLRLLMDQGVGADVARAVIEAGCDDLTAAVARAQALAAVKDTPDFAPLAAGMKRVMNILRKEADQVPTGQPDPALMSDAAERELFEQFSSLEAEAAQRFAAGDFREFLVGLSGLKEAVDNFFDQVMVMVEDENLRRNRLALLNKIASLFGKMAQFTHLQL
jgi:glycyl-tRNA synthetase beta chain